MNPVSEGKNEMMEIRRKAIKTAQRFHIPEGIFLGLITFESGWDPKAKSAAGAIGLTQVMPQTAAALGYNPLQLMSDPQMQLEAGARYLSLMYARFKCWEKAVAAYNAGPHNVEKYNGVPPFNSTQKYVKNVLAFAETYP